MQKRNDKVSAMHCEIYPHEDKSGDWVVEILNIDAEGEIFTTIFSGPDAQKRAEEYAAWKGKKPVQSETSSSKRLRRQP